MIKIIVAYDQNRVIGNKGRIPWKCSEDMHNFKIVTTGHVVAMGRRTWDSIRYKPLVDRLNIVLSRTHKEEDQKGSVYFVSSIEEVLITAARFMPDKDIYVIGGSEIYKLFLEADLVDQMIISKMNGIHEGDVVFPTIDRNVWQEKLIKTYQDFNLYEYTRI